MGQYLNPDASGFAACLKDGDYVDKTGLIAYMNGMLGGKHSLICSTRPRRFGKTFAFQMLAAYYSKGYDCRELFKTLKISADPSFEVHRNRYDVLALDILWFLSNAGKDRNVVDYLQEQVGVELKRSFPDIELDAGASVAQMMLDISLATGRKFVILIDEWDAIFRERKQDLELQQQYINFLRGMFKGTQVNRFIQGAYMTGILPIKKYGTQSALTDFNEFTMLNPGKLAEFVGFTEDEALALCKAHHMDFQQMKHWYDGYVLKNVGHVLCPNSVMQAIENEEFGSYWTQTEAYTALKDYIDLNFDGLKDALISLLGGNSYRVNPKLFLNDLTSLKSKDEVLTLLVHLGYLGYDHETQSVFIPNEEIRSEFIDSIKLSSRKELLKVISLSDAVLKATLTADSEKLADLVGRIHDEHGSLNFYNDEQALRAVIRTAFLTSSDNYDIHEELEGGKGYADMVFIPKKGVNLPPLVVELKWNRLPQDALLQIKERNYAVVFRRFDYSGTVLAVGISYDPKSHKHSCAIEKMVIDK